MPLPMNLNPFVVTFSGSMDIEYTHLSPNKYPNLFIMYDDLGFFGCITMSLMTSGSVTTTIAWVSKCTT